MDPLPVALDEVLPEPLYDCALLCRACRGALLYQRQERPRFPRHFCWCRRCGRRYSFGEPPWSPSDSRSGGSNDPRSAPIWDTDRRRRVALSEGYCARCERFAQRRRWSRRELLLPLWGFTWRCPWRRRRLRLGHRLRLWHWGRLRSHRLEWRRPRWLARTRRVARVWHG